jgi:hypothetical protein
MIDVAHSDLTQEKAAEAAAATDLPWPGLYLDAAGNGDYSTIIAGIEWAVRNDMHVANMSLGADEGMPSLQEAVQAASRAVALAGA